jgi:hypothetical protein
MEVWREEWIGLWMVEREEKDKRGRYIGSWLGDEIDGEGVWRGGEGTRGEEEGGEGGERQERKVYWFLEGR